MKRNNTASIRPAGSWNVESKEIRTGNETTVKRNVDRDLQVAPALNSARAKCLTTTSHTAKLLMRKPSKLVSNQA